MSYYEENSGNSKADQFEDMQRWFTGYGCQAHSRTNPLYKSTYMEYGWYPPNEYTAPLSYHPARRSFTQHLTACGMYRNTSLNTAMDPAPWGK